MNLPYLNSATFCRAIKITSIFILVTLVTFLDSVHVVAENNVIDSPLLIQKIGSNRTIVVDANGQGDFKSVQAAINYVPNRNSKWIVIHIRKGVYREKVTIPRNKPYIFMKGDGKGKTSIVWSKISEKSYDSSTFKLEAQHFIAFGISFKNTALTHTTSHKAVAALVGGDKAAFYECAFFSNHNTLYDYKGTHYYDKCYIQGSIDFIFGQGQAIFHDCEILATNDLRYEIGGSITANCRQNHKESSGFIFINGKVYGIGNVYLGSAKGTHSRVVFANTYLSRSIIPQGWTNYTYQGNIDNLYKAEYKCHGPGSGPNNRVHWSKQLTDEDAAPFLSIDFIKGKEWLPAWFSAATFYIYILHGT